MCWRVLGISQPLFSRSCLSHKEGILSLFTHSSLLVLSFMLDKDRVKNPPRPFCCACPHPPAFTHEVDRHGPGKPVSHTASVRFEFESEASTAHLRSLSLPPPLPLFSSQQSSLLKNCIIASYMNYCCAHFIGHFLSPRLISSGQYLRDHVLNAVFCRGCSHTL